MFRRTLEFDGAIHEELIEDTDGFVVRTHQETDQIIADNSRMRSQPQVGNARLAARIPVAVWHKWMQETNGEIQHNSVMLVAKLNSPEYAYLRTVEGKL